MPEHFRNATDSLRLPYYDNISLNPTTPTTPRTPTHLHVEVDDLSNVPERCQTSPQSVSVSPSSSRGPVSSRLSPQSGVSSPGHQTIHVYSPHGTLVDFKASSSLSASGGSSPSSSQRAKYSVVDPSTSLRKPYKIKLKPPTRLGTSSAHPLNRLKRSSTESVLRGLPVSHGMYTLNDSTSSPEVHRTHNSPEHPDFTSFPSLSSSDLPVDEVVWDRRREKRHRKSGERRRRKLLEEEYNYDADPSIIRIDTLFDSPSSNPHAHKRSSGTPSVQQILQRELAMERGISKSSSDESVASESGLSTSSSTDELRAPRLKRLLLTRETSEPKLDKTKRMNSSAGASSTTKSSPQQQSPANQRRRPILQKAHSMFSLSLHVSQKEHSEILKYQRLNRKFVFMEYSSLPKTEKKSHQTIKREKLSNFLSEEIR